MRIGAHRFALVGLLGLLPNAAKADGTPAPAGSAAGGSTGTVTMAPASDTGASGAAAPAGSAPSGAAAAPADSSAPHTPAPGTEATGYGWSTPKKKGGAHATGKRRGARATTAAASTATPAANEGEGAVVPGFELLGDGSTRVFVQMPKAVQYSAKVEPNKIVYVLKDLRVDKRNDYNPLVTVHFNTPVSSARLVPHGKDLWLVIALRSNAAKAQPAATMQAGKDGTSILQVDFPKGEYLPAGAPAAGSDEEDRPAPSAPSGKPGQIALRAPRPSPRSRRLRSCPRAGPAVAQDQAQGEGQAQEPLVPDLPLAFGADEVSVDPRSKSVDARGNVHVDAPPFHMQGDALTIRRAPLGAEVEGSGVVAFCPCLGTPLGVRFRRANLLPPHDLVLHDPVLEVFGVPVAWLPVFWLRSPGRPGLLPPDVAWRGSDGFFAGGGFHVPLVKGDLERGLDVRAGGYTEGGAAGEVTLRTAASATTVSVDDLRSDVGLGLRSRGTAYGSMSDGESRGVGSRCATRRPLGAGHDRRGARGPSRSTGCRPPWRGRPTGGSSRRG